MTRSLKWVGSTSYMSCEKLAAEISRRSNGKVVVGCRWKYIQTDKDWSRLPELQRIKAIHIEVKTEQATLVERYLSSLFSKKRCTDRVFNTPMRLVPLLSSVSGRSEHCQSGTFEGPASSFFSQPSQYSDLYYWGFTLKSF